MPKRREHDFAVNAFRVVEQAIGEHMDGRPLDVPKPQRATAQRGLKRAAALTAERRKEIAIRAAKTRWKKK